MTKINSDNFGATVMELLMFEMVHVKMGEMLCGWEV